MHSIDLYAFCNCTITPNKTEVGSLVKTSVCLYIQNFRDLENVDMIMKYQASIPINYTNINTQV